MGDGESATLRLAPAPKAKHGLAGHLEALQELKGDPDDLKKIKEAEALL